MLKRFKRKWLRLWHSRPGRRFQNYYRRTHRQKNNDEMAPRIGRFVVGALCLAVGICLIVFPLVYVPFFVLGSAMLASESPRFARILDHGETWSRASWARSQEKFGVRNVKVAVWALSLACLGLTGHACYTTFVR
jgi:uncharacterized membrane protein YbaN (DUF454 family)